MSKLTRMFLALPDYGFEYSDEEPEEEDVDIENQYYNSKGTHRLKHLLWGLPAAKYATELCSWAIQLRI